MSVLQSGSDQFNDGKQWNRNKDEDNGKSKNRVSAGAGEAINN
jgi:hypothetical protein